MEGPGGTTPGCLEGPEGTRLADAEDPRDGEPRGYGTESPGGRGQAGEGLEGPGGTGEQPGGREPGRGGPERWAVMGDPVGRRVQLLWSRCTELCRPSFPGKTDVRALCQRGGGGDKRLTPQCPPLFLSHSPQISLRPPQLQTHCPDRRADPLPPVPSTCAGDKTSGLGGPGERRVLGGTRGWTRPPGPEARLLLGEDLAEVPEVSFGSRAPFGQVLQAAALAVSCRGSRRVMFAALCRGVSFSLYPDLGPGWLSSPGMLAAAGG